MKVCWSIVRDIEKQHGKLLREDLIHDLVDMGVPQDIAEQLLYKDRLEFFGDVAGVKTQIVLDILFPDTPMI